MSLMLKGWRLYLIILGLLFFGAFGHGFWVCRITEFPRYSDPWHFWQIAPILTLMIGCVIFGWEMMRRYVLHIHNFYGYLGRVAGVAGSAWAGYSLSLDIFMKI